MQKPNKLTEKKRTPIGNDDARTARVRRHDEAEQQAAGVKSGRLV